jgi:ribulose-5-phosphate 4-epimerase/fuculose-1-phosphate aldolase
MTVADVVGEHTARVMSPTKTLPMPPVFSTVAEEREYRKVRLAAAFRLFSACGFDPGEPETFWVNPFGMHFSLISASDLIRVDHEGHVVEGDRPVNQAAFCIHSQVHAARPDVMAAAHAHSLHGKTYSAFARELDMLTQDSCAFYRDHAVLHEYSGVVNDIEEGRKIARALADHKAVILRNHGLLTVGRSVDEAAWWFVTMERTCQSQLLAMAAAGGGAGAPKVVEPDIAQITYEVVGSSYAGWFSFQPLFDRIFAAQPDLAH